MDTQLLQRIDNDKEMLFLQLAQLILNLLAVNYVLVDLLLDVRERDPDHKVGFERKFVPLKESWGQF